MYNIKLENYVPKPLTPEQDKAVDEILAAADKAAAELESK